MTKRLTGVVLVFAAGCVFTPRPMIPFAPDGGDLASASPDAGGAFGADAATGVIPGADSGAPWSADAAASDAPPAPADSRCRPAGDGGDAGYLDEQGRPCDPTATETNDGGAADVRDAACDGSADAAGDVTTDGAGRSCDGGVAAGLARGR
ncbi:MAG: hypothetical protein Q7V43_17160 [Myxococcales bacterium]|nr:hypothetical protein [Myxococcales bacterium]